MGKIQRQSRSIVDERITTYTSNPLYISLGVITSPLFSLMPPISSVGTIILSYISDSFNLDLTKKRPMPKYFKSIRNNKGRYQLLVESVTPLITIDDAHSMAYLKQNAGKLIM